MVVGGTAAYRLEFRGGKEGIRCNGVSPGPIATETWLRTIRDVGVDPDQVRATSPSGRLGEPADIAGTVAFLLSDDAAGINAQIIHVNGGRVVR